jgi:hypothetical protein
MTIHRDPRRAPDPRHPQDVVGPVRGGRDHAAHRLDLCRAKGRPASQVLDLHRQQLVGRGEIADLGLEAADLDVTVVDWPGLQRRLARDQEGVAPPAKLGRRHPELALYQLQALPRAAAATRRSACAWPISAGAAKALARRRQRVGRAPSGQHPVPTQGGDAVGTPVTGRPQHRSVRAAFPHTAPTSGV